MERLSPEALYEQLLDYRLINKQDLTGCGRLFPIAVGNHTDMCLTPRNSEYLLDLARVHFRVLGKTPLCVITKAVLDERFVEQLSKTGANLIVLVSLSFLPQDYERGLPHWRNRLSNFKVLNAYGISSIHWWRPLTRVATPDVQTAIDQFAAVRDAGATCVVGYGLGYSDEMAREFADPRHPMNSAYSDVAMAACDSTWSFEQIWSAIAETAGPSSYPTFRSTGCAVSFIEQVPCFTARFRRIYQHTSCFVGQAPPKQTILCQSLKVKMPDPGRVILDQVADFLETPREAVAFNVVAEVITVACRVSQEDQMHLTQVTGFPVVAAELDDTLAWRGDTPTIADLTN